MAKQKQADYLKEEKDVKGFEDINMETMAVPFVKVLQLLSPELNARKPEYIKDAEVGDFVNNVTGTNYGKEIEVVIMSFERIYTEWKPNRGGFVGRHTPEHAADIAEDMTFGKWKTAEGNILSENYVYFVVVIGHEDEGVSVLSLSSTQIKEAKKLNKLLVTRRFEDGGKIIPWHQTYKVMSEFQSNDQGEWYGVKFEFSGIVDKNLYFKVKEERNLIGEKKVDYSQLEDHSSEKSSSSSDNNSEESSPY